MSLLLVIGKYLTAVMLFLAVIVYGYIVCKFYKELRSEDEQHG